MSTNQSPGCRALLIGTDGINSRVRSALIGDGPPRDNGRIIWRGVVDAADLPGDRDDVCPPSTTALAGSKVGKTLCFMDVGKDGKG